MFAVGLVDPVPREVRDDIRRNARHRRGGAAQWRRVGNDQRDIVLAKQRRVARHARVERGIELTGHVDRLRGIEMQAVDLDDAGVGDGVVEREWRGDRALEQPARRRRAHQNPDVRPSPRERVDDLDLPRRVAEPVAADVERDGCQLSPAACLCRLLPAYCSRAAAAAAGADPVAGALAAGSPATSGSATCKTSASEVAPTNFMSRRTSSGSSTRSCVLPCGSTTVLIPWRRAAIDFSRMPPTGSTRPESVISPVIATSDRTGTPRAAETIAVAIVTPADGPSLGIAPAGTWICRSCLLNVSGVIPSAAACCRTWLSAARADSCITLPSCPVNVRCPLPPGRRTASIYNTSPPTSVHASPVATPGRDNRNAPSERNRAGPR